MLGSGILGFHPTSEQVFPVDSSALQMLSPSLGRLSSAQPIPGSPGKAGGTPGALQGEEGPGRVWFLQGEQTKSHESLILQPSVPQELCMEKSPKTSRESPANVV